MNKHSNYSHEIEFKLQSVTHILQKRFTYRISLTDLDVSLLNLQTYRHEASRTTHTQLNTAAQYVSLYT
jgi:hypothetical protein